MENESESNNTQAHNNQEDSTIENEKKKYEEEKKALLEQINELKQFVNEAELTLNSVKYGDVQIKNKNELISFNSDFPTSLSSKRILSNVNMEYELYKLAGLYCTKSLNNEFVFNVSASSNDGNSSAVQFFVEDDKVTLGHWVMPIGITIDYILAETPLEQPIHVIPFLRNCKRHVLCHEQRKQQFDQLKQCLATTKNCQITSNFGYLTIVIIFNQVTNKQTNQKMNFTVNLFYNSGTVRPHTLKINSPSEELSLHFRNYSKKLKKDMLQDAYNSIINQSHPIFKWEPEITTEEDQVLESNKTALENNEDSESDSDFKYSAKKRKRGRNQHTKPVEKISVDSVNLEKSSDDSEHVENEPVIKTVPKKKSVARPRVKKLKVTKEKPSSKMIQPKVNLKTKNTRNISSKSNEAKNVEFSEPVNVVENHLQKSQGENTQKQAKQETKKSITTKSPEKQANISTISTRSQQAKLNLKTSKIPIMKKSQAKENSVLNKKTTYTSTPMVGKIKRTKQLTLNLSPIVSESIDTAEAKGIRLRRSPRKK
ncbi:uncharacterized protein [Chelonus insularis]|uniref:uncharacterized protein n=1 Tax=Chelonus insularis TaxID=460826 RepID=UPI00158BE516|nr:uncharacterized protein LOC118073484 [Chelonus insularis]